ncbi:uncharacterized protein ARMOST_18559 [Armillaria ostoyae]|uniref:Uncharacterized protein n=1 Tax=Armillaria ostoyae TaxID=47428 RepID=A0A284S286_ARMOS|nr:uncharacterized protein ARMOST_18559 [Armillaria ostoyae]
MNLIAQLGATLRRFIYWMCIGIGMSHGRDDLTIDWGNITQIYIETCVGLDLWESGDTMSRWEAHNSLFSGESETRTELDIFVKGVGDCYKGRALTAKWDARTPHQKTHQSRGTAVFWDSGMEPNVLDPDFLDTLKKSENLD